ncbi:type VI secretion system-associated protein TagF [Rhodobacteraceae bacterium D3-12]|nr:type VI secretion system-associated protein TagF [Rhodobacteraceae bacterium D3-12]
MAGFFGKLPTRGDFLARGLLAGHRSWLDAWLTRWLASAANMPDLWPPGGLRGVLDAPDEPLVVVIGPSIDLPGREFPILACTPAHGATRETADQWANLAAVALSRAVRGEYDADTLLAALNSIPDPATGGTPAPAPILWSDRQSGPPETLIPALFGENQISSD